MEEKLCHDNVNSILVMRVSFCVIFLIIPFFVFAQKIDQWTELKSKYPDQPAVYMDRSETLTLSVKGDSIEAYTDVFEDMLYLKEKSEVLADRRVHGSHFNEVGDIKAKTLVWDKSRHKELSVSDFAKKFDTDDGIFYDDSYYYAFTFPSVGPRNHTQLQYRINYKDPRFIPGFVFSSYIPQEKSVFTVRTIGDIELSYEVFNNDEGQIRFKKFTKGKETFYEWSVNNVQPFKVDGSSPSIRYFAPHIICYVKSFTAEGKKKNVLSGLDDLYGWYYTFVKDIENNEPSKDLVAIVNSLKKDSKTEEETVRKVFYWVQNNIRYVAFEEGMRGFVPHSGSYVCDKRYGDCKDMASIIVNMLKIAGIKSYYTWIGTRDIPYTYSAVPTPMVDNHMIATYISTTGRYYFLDATDSRLKFGLPSSMIQGKEALIGKGPDKYEVKVVPGISKEVNLIADSVTLSIKDTELIGTGMVTLDGYPKIVSGYRLDRVEKDDTKQYVVNLVGKGSNKFYLDNYSIDNLTDRDKPTEIKYAFRIGDYFQKIGDEIYVNMNLNKDHYNHYLTDRKTPWETDYKYVKTESCVLDIPQEYAVDYLPENVNYDGKSVGIQVRYEQLANQIVMHKKFYIDFLLMKPDLFNDWNESIKYISDVYKEAIILKKK